jgi:hypothetical protein
MYIKETNHLIGVDHDLVRQPCHRVPHFGVRLVFRFLVIIIGLLNLYPISLSFYVGKRLKQPRAVLKSSSSLPRTCELQT